MKKAIALVLTLVMALSMVVAVSADSIYSCFSTSYEDAVGWYFVNDYTLMVNQEAGTYQLMFKNDIFGTTDPGVKGVKNVIYSGKCTVAPAADGETAHLDVTIETVDNIYFEQHEKAFGRRVLNFAMVLDTANWTDDMEDIYGDTCEAFLENHQAPLGAVITVEDLALDYDDVTLVNKIVSNMDELSLDITE